MKQPILFILVIGLLFSCKKDTSQGNGNACMNANNTSFITSPDLINCKYISGTYWVYIDSVSLQTDSTYINTYNSGMATDACNNSYETHSFGTVSSPSMNTESYAVVTSGLFKNVSGINSGTRIYADYSGTLSLTNFITSKCDSLFIYDQMYYNVLVATVDIDYSEGSNKSVYYINSEYGFLRHEIYENSVLISNRILMDKNIVR